MESELLKCQYPNCNCKAEKKWVLENIKNSKEQVTMLFCDYHFFIVAGDIFKCKKIPYKNKYELVGDFKLIQTIEQVMGARELILKLKSNDSVR